MHFAVFYGSGMPSSCNVPQVENLLETVVIYEPNNQRAALIGGRGDG